MKFTVITVRVSEADKAALSEIAHQRRTTISALIQAHVTTLVADAPAIVADEVVL